MEPEPALVPVARATVARAEPFADTADAEGWLAELRRDEARLRAEVDDAVAVLNRVLRAHRAAAADPFAREIRVEQAFVRRAGYGDGELVAAGAAVPGIELSISPGRRRRGELLAPQSRLAAVLSGRERQLVAEELVLRARLDLDLGRPREAALQARIALEALLAELGDEGRGLGSDGGRPSEPNSAQVERKHAGEAGAPGAGASGAHGAHLAEHRERIARAANAALDGEPSASEQATVSAAIERMEQALFRRRVGGGRGAADAPARAD